MLCCSNVFRVYVRPSHTSLLLYLNSRPFPQLFVGDQRRRPGLFMSLRQHRNAYNYQYTNPLTSRSEKPTNDLLYTSANPYKISIIVYLLLFISSLKKFGSFACLSRINMFYQSTSFVSFSPATAGTIGSATYSPSTSRIFQNLLVPVIIDSYCETSKRRDCLNTHTAR